MKLWEGRFTQPSAKSADEFNQSLGFDYKLYWHDILASIAHVKMLGETQIIPKENADKISHAKAAELSLEFGASVTDVPYNEGAARYFEEQGFTVPTA